MADRLDLLKRGAPSGFSAVRGRRGPPLGFSAVRGKRGPPLGFSAVRGRKRGPPLGFSAVRGKRLPPMGFSAVRGKRGPPSGFSAVRGKRKIPTGFSAVRGKKADAELKDILMQNYNNALLNGGLEGGIDSHILPQGRIGFDNSLWDEDNLPEFPQYFDDRSKEGDLLQAMESQGKIWLVFLYAANKLSQRYPYMSQNMKISFPAHLVGEPRVIPTDVLPTDGQ